MTVAVCVPELENILLQVKLDPVQAPDHEYVYEPVPPEDEALKVDDWLALIELGFAEQETERLGAGWLCAFTRIEPPQPPR